jgi:hypothetical protein
MIWNTCFHLLKHYDSVKWSVTGDIYQRENQTTVREIQYFEENKVCYFISGTKLHAIMGHKHCKTIT